MIQMQRLVHPWNYQGVEKNSDCVYLYVIRGQKLGPKRAGMTGVSRGIEYPLLHEILYTVSET